MSLLNFFKVIDKNKDDSENSDGDAKMAAAGLAAGLFVCSKTISTCNMANTCALSGPADFKAAPAPVAMDELGANKPAKRKRADSSACDDAQTDKAGKYERGKEFQDEWFLTFKWLDKDACVELNAFVCTPCTLTNQPNCSFNKNSGGAYKDNLRRDKLKPHQDSPTHSRAVNELRERQTQTQPQIDTLPPLPDTDKEEIIRRAKMLMWLSAEEIAHSKFSSMCALYDGLLNDGVKSAVRSLTPGLQVLEKSPMPRNAKYTSHFFARQMLESISTVVENQHIDYVRRSPAVGVIVDDSTDDANIKQLSVVVRYVVDGVARLAFLGMIDIPEGGAETVYNETAKLVTSKGITVDQILAFASDGASAMTGTFVLHSGSY